MAWFWLSFTVVTDVVATIALASTGGRFQVLPVSAAVLGYALSFIGLSQAMRQIDVAVVYALWSAAGTAAVAVLGTVLFGELMTLARAIWLAVIVVGVVGLQLTGSSSAAATTRPTHPVDPVSWLGDCAPSYYGLDGVPIPVSGRSSRVVARVVGP